MILKDYQENAVSRLFERGLSLLRRDGDKRMVFKSPTGSGKTLMVAEFLTRLADCDIAPPFCCIWIAPRKLHRQSYDKLARHYEDSRAMVCRYFHDLHERQIGRYEILFLNWESVRQENHIIIRENERDMYLDKILENTGNAGRAIVLVIDESHYQANADRARALIEKIAPKLTVEVSATPMLDEYNEMVPVEIDDVKAEGMIKKSVVLNDGIGAAISADVISVDENSDEFVLHRALRRRAELAAAFAAEGANVNPLLCIQLPDRKTNMEDGIKARVLRTLADGGITVQNGKLAVYLSEEKENLENISRNDNGTEVMLFKQAIALGWDCPRAHILVLFRDWRNVVFSVQTLGRIMRMPAPDVGHYKNELLNSGYVYTNLPEVHLHQDIAGGYVRVYSSRRAKEYAPLKLPSVHRLRQREQTRLSPRFIDLFLDAAKEYDLARKIKRENQQVQTGFIADFTAAGVDALTGEKIAGNMNVNVDNEEDLQKLFDYFARDNLAPFYPDARSIGRVKMAIYEFFGGPLEMGVADYFSEIIKITLSDSNKQHFVNVLSKAKDAYIRETERRKEPLQKTPEWEVPESVDYGKNYEEHAAKKSVMQPFYIAREWETELAFIRFLENSDEVCWWYKNGEGESKYFAVPYSKDGEDAPFYVDFVVRFAGGGIGLYDTKSGFTLREAGSKSDGLLRYIAEQKRAGKKLHGGIITPHDSRNYDAGWKIYSGKGENIALPNESPDGWDWLEWSRNF